MSTLVATLVLLVATFFIGRAIERRHLLDLAQRENACRDMLTVTLREPPASAGEVARAELVVGSTVVSHDYFKRFSAGLKALVGGSLRAYEPLMERARREALQRMREQARQRGHNLVIRVRLETATLASVHGNQGLGGIEVLAYGTALTLRSAPAVPPPG